jgi:hypothetical protein
VSDLNATPSVTLLPSPESMLVGVAKSKIVSCGVTALDGEDSGLDPTALLAVTVNVYAVPLVSPLTVAEVADAFDTWTGAFAVDPTYGVTVYPVIALPPLSDGALQLTCAELDAGIAPTPVGAVGTLAAVGVTAFDGAEAAAVPALLEAVTVNV